MSELSAKYHKGDSVSRVASRVRSPKASKRASPSAARTKVTKARGKQTLLPEKKMLAMRNPWPKGSVSFFAWRQMMVQYKQATTFQKKWQAQGALLTSNDWAKSYKKHLR